MNQDNIDVVFPDVNSWMSFRYVLAKIFPKRVKSFGNNSKISSLFRNNEVKKMKKKQNKGINHLKLSKLYFVQHFRRHLLIQDKQWNYQIINNRITGSACEICSKLTTRTPEQCQ